MTSLATTPTSNSPFASLLSRLNDAIQVLANAKANNVEYCNNANNNDDEYGLVRSIILSVADTMENSSTK